MSDLYFGEPWNSGVCESGIRRPTPVGERCCTCQEPIETDDRGVIEHHMAGGAQLELRPTHRECALRRVVGGIGHHLDHEFWCETMHDPDAGLGYRESARRVWALANGNTT